MMHLPPLLWLTLGCAAIALATIIPPPVAPFLAPVRGFARSWLNGPGIGFAAATAVVGVIGLTFQAWIQDQTGIEVPLGTVRWALMTSELGLWLPLLSWTTAIGMGILVAVRARAAATGIPPWALFGGIAWLVWYAW